MNINPYSDLSYSIIDDIIWNIRKDFLKLAEEFRQNKIIGKSEELGLLITWKCRDEFAGPVWRGELLQTLLKSSWVVMQWKYHDDELSWDLHAWDLKEDDSFVQCPRCFLFHLNRYSDGTTKDNYDNLCDRCLRVMLQGYSSHPTMDDYFNNRPYLANTRHISL